MGDTEGGNREEGKQWMTGSRGEKKEKGRKREEKRREAKGYGEWRSESKRQLVHSLEERIKPFRQGMALVTNLSPFASQRILFPPSSPPLAICWLADFKHSNQMCLVSPSDQRSQERDTQRTESMSTREKC